MNAESTYSIFAKYYDSYVGDFQSDLPCYTSTCSPSDSILEIGCGTGRVLSHLLKSGFNATGVDISNDMLSIARIKLKHFLDHRKLSLVNHDFFKSPMHSRFSKVFVTYYTFNYILDDAELFLKHIFQSMSPSSILLMDLFYPSSFSNPSSDSTTKTVFINHNGASIKVEDSRSLKGKIENRIQTYFSDINPTTISTRRKFYPKIEISNLLQATGFSSIHFSEDYNPNGFKIISRDNEDTIKSFLVKAIKS